MSIEDRGQFIKFNMSKRCEGRFDLYLPVPSINRWWTSLRQRTARPTMSDSGSRTANGPRSPAGPLPRSFLRPVIAMIPVMAESLPMPYALRFVIEDDAEWELLLPYLARGEFPAGMNSWLYQNDQQAKLAGNLVDECERRLAAALANGRLSASGRQAGATHISQTDGARCKEVEILGDDGSDLRIDGLDYASVWLARPDAKDSVGKLAEKRKLEVRIKRALEPFIAQLKVQRGQTNYEELRALLSEKGFGHVARSLLEKAAASAGLTKDMIRRGRPRGANPTKE